MNTQALFADLKAEIIAAGKLAQSYFDSDNTDNEIKADGSVVTEIDTQIEKQLVAFILERFPKDSIVGEEGEGHTGTSDYVWHIDPIDGTDNFLREIPFSAISVARLGSTTDGSFGIVYNPTTKRMFSAFADGGVYENDREHQVNQEQLGGKAIISIATAKEAWMKSAKYNLLKEFGTRFGRGTALNCLALELGYVAANRIDATLILGLQTYDYAAGVYLLKAAGGVVYVFEEGQWQLHTGSTKNLCNTHGKIMIASYPGLAEQLVKMIGDPRQWADE